MKWTFIFSLVIILAQSVTAQSVATRSEAQNQKLYTYQEAIAVLKAEKPEFAAKGEYPTVGQQIYSLRSKKNVSLSTLAFIVGLKKDVLVKIEQNKTVPNREIIAKIEEFLGDEIILMDR